MTRVRALWEYLRGTYWAVPSAMAFAAVALSFGMIQLDEAATPKLLERLSWVYTGGPEGARAVLSTIASSMITVAGVAFSITIVALTLASQQFGPRLLRNFLRDVGNQIVLGTFVATFIYCLLVLRTVRGNDAAQFVPHLAVTGGVVLAMLSLGVLIFFIHHVSTSIQASQIIANVSEDLDGAIDRLFPERIGAAATADDSGRASPDLPAACDDSARVVYATANGYVQAIDGDRLLTSAHKHDLVVHVHARPGMFVTKGSVLLTVCSRSDPTHQRFGDVFIVGGDRTGTQDVTFFINQLVELAVRALSPGINDPGTARICIDRLEQALCHLAGRQMPSACRYDKAGGLRVVASPVTFAEIADSAFAEIARYGRSSVSVTCRLLEATRRIASCVQRDSDRLALVRHATIIADGTREATFAEADCDEIAERYHSALTALGVAPGEDWNAGSHRQHTD